MSKKKILHVSYSMDTGGGPLTLKRLVEDFPEYDHHVAGNEGVFLQHFRKTLLPEKVMRLRGPNLVLNLKLILEYCRKNGIDILHVHGRGAGSFARFVKVFRKRTKVVYTPNGFFPRSLPFVIRQGYVRGERMLLRLTDIVFLVSDSECRTFRHYVSDKQSNKYVVVQNYLNPASGNYEVIKNYPLSKDSINFLYIGRLCAQKGTDILIEALKQVTVPNVKAHIVGYGEEEAYVRKELESPELKGKAVFLGKINEAFRLMPNFDALLLPSRFEGLPFTILEAMLYKLPLIVTPANGIIDILNKHNSYMADDISPQEFADAIHAFVSDWNTDRERITRTAEENHRLLMSTYSYDAVKGKIEYIYQ